MSSRTYHVGPSTISIAIGDLTTSKAEVLVSSDDYMLSMGGGVSAALRRVAGPSLVEDSKKMVPANGGDLIVTSAADLSAKYVFHAITIGKRELDMPPGAIVRRATQRAIRLLPQLGCRSIAFPALGTGTARIPLKTAAAEMAGVLVSELQKMPEALDVTLYLMPRDRDADVDILFRSFESYIQEKLGLGLSESHGDKSFESPGATNQRREQIVRMLQHLDSRRDVLEAKLMDVISDPSAEEQNDVETLRKQLDEIRSLRASYEAELATGAEPTPAAKRNSVFVSSTSHDLQPHRNEVRGVIEQSGYQYIGMEDFVPTRTAPASLIQQKVDESEIYLGIIGLRYGYVDASSGLSMTELEYRQAIASSKPVCIFLMDDEATITPGMVERDPESYAKLLAFRERITTDHTCGFFKDESDLGHKVAPALKEAAMTN